MISKLLTIFSLQVSEKFRGSLHFLKAHNSQSEAMRGFTLIETLVAITLITVAIVAPMALTVQSISVAYYARDQIIASNLAQEGIEVVRAVRDANILQSAHGTATPLFSNIPIGDGTTNPFEVDGTKINVSDMIISSCGACTDPLEISGGEYAYTGIATPFTRTMHTKKLWSDSGGNAQEIQVTSKVSWQTASYQTESVTLVEDLYNWPPFGAATP